MAPTALARPRVTSGSLVIASADPACRRRLRQSLGAETHARSVFDVSSHPDLQRHIAALLPSVILFDLGAEPDANALGVVSALSALAKTIVLADTDDDPLAIQALKAGASGFCSREPRGARRGVSRRSDRPQYDWSQGHERGKTDRVERSPRTLSVAVVASDQLRQRCHAILAGTRGDGVQSRGVGFADAPGLLRRYRPRVLLLDAVDRKSVV